VIVSFLGLVFTGMPLKFSQAGWAVTLSHLMGGFEAARLIHRFCALLTFGYFGLHLAYVARFLAAHRDFDLFGPDSMMPRWKDLSDFVAQVKWFLGRGPRPRFDRWTYWEKFDYWAVFWGVSIIGSSGLVLWFPEFFARVLPGWVFNVATVVHSDEALLAAGFIFTIHFFHTHLRPGKFPMDDVIFTGRISLEELKAERPEEYERLAAQGRIADYRRPPPPREDRPWIRAFGLTALALGLTAIVLVITALLGAGR
jgi:cytochrome b subunit of formate dehydrogenase